MVVIEHTLEKRSGFTEAWDDWTLVKIEYQKSTVPLLDAKTVAGLFVHEVRNSPCVNLVGNVLEMSWPCPQNRDMS